MVEETQVPGASVPEVTQRHGVYPNLLSIWRRLYRQGLLYEKDPSHGPLLPVKVSTPTVLPSELAATPKATQKSADAQIDTSWNGSPITLSTRSMSCYLLTFSRKCHHFKSPPEGFLGPCTIPLRRLQS
jgi:transposase-like protein